MQLNLFKKNEKSFIRNKNKIIISANSKEFKTIKNSRMHKNGFNYSHKRSIFYDIFPFLHIAKVKTFHILKTLVHNFSFLRTTDPSFKNPTKKTATSRNRRKFDST